MCIGQFVTGALALGEVHRIAISTSNTNLKPNPISKQSTGHMTAISALVTCTCTNTKC